LSDLGSKCDQHELNAVAHAATAEDLAIRMDRMAQQSAQMAQQSALMAQQQSAQIEKAALRIQEAALRIQDLEKQLSDGRARRIQELEKQLSIQELKDALIARKLSRSWKIHVKDNVDTNLPQETKVSSF
jgi:hypothetical protein